MCKRNLTDLNKNNIKILICCHKHCELPPNPDGIFLPIQVGAAISDIDLGIQRDDQVNGQSCDNISAKNKCYCELTAIYWAWKNIKKLCPNLKYIGLNHYRRYFDFNKKNILADSAIEENEVKNYMLDFKLLQKIFLKNKAIVAKPVLFPFSLSICYCISHFSEHYKILRDIVHLKFSKFGQSFDKALEKNNAFSAYNMFIMSYEDFCAYCEFLFGALFKVENAFNFSSTSDYQNRVYGFLAERLLNVWIEQNRKKIKFYPIIKFSKSVKKNSNFMYLLKNFIYRTVFKVTKYWGKLF